MCLELNGSLSWHLHSKWRWNVRVQGSSVDWKQQNKPKFSKLFFPTSDFENGFECKQDNEAAVLYSRLVFGFCLFKYKSEFGSCFAQNLNENTSWSFVIESMAMGMGMRCEARWFMFRLDFDSFATNWKLAGWTWKMNSKPKPMRYYHRFSCPRCFAFSSIITTMISGEHRRPWPDSPP